MKLLVFCVGLLIFISEQQSSASLLGNLELFNEAKIRDHEELSKVLLERKMEFTHDMIRQAIEIVFTPYINATDEPEGIPVEDIQCAFQFLGMITDFQDGKLWPLMMLDAWAKIQSGFARGNIRNPGHFTQCVNLKVPMTNPDLAGEFFNGKHCTIGFRGIREGEFNWTGIPIITPLPIFDMLVLFFET